MNIKTLPWKKILAVLFLFFLLQVYHLFGG